MVNNKIIKIAFSGKAGSGKNTAVNIAKNFFRKKRVWVKVFAFADPVKDIARKYFPNLPRKYFFGKSSYRNHIIPNATDAHGNDLTVRKLLQDIGSNGRKYNQNIWIDNIISKIKQFKSSSTLYNSWLLAVSDVRFINEFNALKENEFIIIRIKRETETLNDVSEIEQDLIPDSEFDYIIDNNGTKQELIEKINQICTTLL